MSDDLFNSPASGAKFNAADHKGKLLLITPTGYKEGISTSFGTKDAVEANIVVVDEQSPAGSQEIDSALLFGGVLIGQTKAYVGKGLVLGRLSQKPTDKGNPAWVLSDPTDGDKDKARAYLATKAPAL